MSKFLSIAVAASLLATAAATAQDQPNRPGDRGPQRETPQGSHRPSPNPGHRPGRPPSPPRPGPGPRPPSWGHRPPHHYLNGGRWRPSLRGPAYHYPPGFRYRRWAAGALLPPIFLSSAYYYNNYPALGLSPPPPGYQWVRYGSDLLLVNIATGRIADVVDGAFY
jgi:Ni/Co efflux regulator RcnB